MDRDEHQRRRVVVAGVVLGLGFLLVLARLFQLQVVHADDLAKRAGRQHQKVLTVEGARGTIYDRNGKMLALNMEVPSIFGEPRVVKDPGDTAAQLARLLRTDARPLESRLKSGRDFVWLERRLPPEQAERLRGVSLPGIGVVPEGRHFYPKGTLLAHVLGFANVDNEGLEGVERSYDLSLAGGRGHVIVERDALGGAVFPKGLNYLAPAPGRDLILTIDEVIQYMAEQELEQVVTQTRAEGGMVVVVEPKTGAVLALAVRPTFDPNTPGTEASLHRNRAITDLFEPGSTFKLVAAAAALEEQVVTPSELIYGEDGRFMVEHTIVHDHHKNGWMTFAEVVQRSSNIGIIKVAQRLGPETLHRYSTAFGFGQRTGVDLPGEVRGLLKAPAAWERRSLASIAMGQEVAVNALQVTMAAAAIANGGQLMRPYVVSAIRAPTGEILERTAPVVRRRAVSAETARTLTEILHGVTLPGGTGTLAALPGYAVAGKTGTAQKVDPLTGRYSATRTVSSFVGFLPADDPQLTIFVVVDEPKTDQWGGTVAAPVFQRIAAQAVRHLGIPPQEGPDGKGRVLARLAF